MVPVEVPCTSTDAPINGSLAASVTVPVTVFVCAKADAEASSQRGICNSPGRPDRNGYRSLHGIKNRKSLHPRQVFWALPRIYQGKIEELKGVMVRKEAAELIGTVTGSKTLINMAKRRKKGEEMELCNSLKRLVEEHEKIGESRGLEKGVTKGRILIYHDVGWEEARIAEKLKISRKEVRKVLKKAGESK